MTAEQWEFIVKALNTLINFVGLGVGICVFLLSSILVCVARRR